MTTIGSTVVAGALALFHQLTDSFELGTDAAQPQRNPANIREQGPSRSPRRR